MHPPVALTLGFLGLVLNAPVGRSAAAHPVAPALEADVVALYIPPTRSDELFAATADAVYHWAPDRTNWATLYEPPAGAKPLRAFTGYAKTSKVLFLAHSAGGACSKDGGQTWTEFTLARDDAAPEPRVALAVHPGDRRQAVLAEGHSAWITEDQGATWRRLALPEAEGVLCGLGYSGGDRPRLAALTERALYVRASASEPWLLQTQLATPATALALSPASPCAFVATRGGEVVVADLSRPGYRLAGGTNLTGIGGLACDSGSRGVLWVARAAGINRVAFGRGGAVPHRLHETVAPVRALHAHPRQPDSVCWAEGRQVFALAAALGDAAGPSRETLDAADFLPAEAAPTVPPSAPTPVSERAAPLTATPGAEAFRISREILAEEPPLDQVIEAALRQSHFQQGELSQWKRVVRRRNWAPRFWARYGLGETTADRSGLITNVDRFGVPDTEDIRLNDSVKGLHEVSVGVTWDLSRLLFDPEQVDVNAEQRLEARQRNDLIQLVTKLYYERVELLLRQRVLGDRMSVTDQAGLHLKSRQIADTLNALCGAPLYSISTALSSTLRQAEAHPPH